MESNKHFKSRGGTPPYTSSLTVNNSGAIFDPASTSFFYQAGTTGGFTDTVVVTDSSGDQIEQIPNQSVTVLISVNPKLNINFAGIGTGKVEATPGPSTSTVTVFNDATLDYPSGTTVTLTATPTGLGNNASTFTGWGGNGCSSTKSTITVDMTQDLACTATFTVIPPQTLTLTPAGNGTGSVTGAGTYDFGTAAPVTATAAAGSTFVGWSGPNGTECTTGSVLMNADKQCIATFTLNPQTLTLTPAGNGTGSVTGAGTYDFGTAAPVTATAATGSTFVGWSGPNGTECTAGSVLMNADKQCIATFTLNPQTLTLTPAGNGTGSVTGAGTYDFGTAAPVTATAAAGSTFAGLEWAECRGMYRGVRADERG